VYTHSQWWIWIEVQAGCVATTTHYDRDLAATGPKRMKFKTFRENVCAKLGQHWLSDKRTVQLLKVPPRSVFWELTVELCFSYFQGCAHSNPTLRSRVLRSSSSSNQLQVPPINLILCSHSHLPQVFGTPPPDSIHSSDTFNSFQCHLKTHFFQAAFNTS